MGIGAIVMLTPAIGWAWPALLPLVTAAAAALGYKKLTDPNFLPELEALLKSDLTKKLENIRRVQVSLDSVLTEIIAEDLGAEERIAFQRDDFILVFRKDARGKFFVEVSGPKTQTALSLKIRGEEFAVEVIKRFAYHKMIEQMTVRGATIVREEVKDTGEIELTARQWH